MRGPRRLGIVLHGADAGTINLGNEPPLTIGDESEAERTPVRRAVSFRWLSGTILTGVTSIVLMGGALMAALNDPNQFADLPESFNLASSEEGSDEIAFGQKADRIQPLDEQISSRQVLQVSTVTRQGERDFIKLRPFAKINATLAQRKGEFAAQIPVYDALRIFADTSAPEPPVQSADAAAASAAADDRFYGANVDGEVSIKVSAFPGDAPDLETAGGLDTVEVEQVVRAAAHLAIEGEDFGSGDGVDGALGFAEAGVEAEPGDDPFSALGVKIIPENVSNVAKSDGTAAPEPGLEERIVSIGKKDNLRSLLLSNSVNADDTVEIVSTMAELVDLNSLHEGQKIRIGVVTPEADGTALRPVRISIYDNGAHQATVARADDNSFVRADEPNSMPDAFAETETAAADFAAMPKIYDALYETALEQEVPTPLIEQLVRIFAFDVDFQARITPGDTIEIFHSLPDTQDPDASEPEVLYASLNVGGVAKKFYRYRTADDGIVDYYDGEGKSAKKFLMRKPMTAGNLRSGFGMRVHPILGYRRMHAGVDFAAPRGTPILAAGNGTVEKAGRSSGYGNLTVLQHTNGYETAYGHQQGFAKGIVPGARVRQGQIIGYVGSTGLSTGPHLHFEIRVNRKAVDPLRIRLPRGRVLAGDLLKGFEHERDRIDALLDTGQGSTKVASTN